MLDRRLVWIGAILLTACPAQAADLAGRVVDVRGAAVVNARVLLLNSFGSAIRQAVAQAGVADQSKARVAH